MKSIWGIVVVVILSFFILYGLSISSLKIATTQPLSEESMNQISVINTQIAAYQKNVTSKVNSGINPDPQTQLTGVDAYVQEYKDSKSKIDSLKEIIYLGIKIPDVIFLVIPFVEPSDLGIYIGVFRGVIWILILLIIYIAIREGNVFQ